MIPPTNTINPSSPLFIFGDGSPTNRDVEVALDLPVALPGFLRLRGADTGDQGFLDARKTKLS